jgi:hypothetical protein
VSVDLDAVHHYRRIHGLPARREGAHVVHEIAVARALRFAAEHGAPLTFFAVAEDLERASSARVLADAARAGHAVESHSSTHPYDLVRLGDRIAREVGESFDVIERAVGRRPRGFRAPGYTVSDAVLDALEREGALFDSSVFPSWPYYALKAAALGALALRGRHSASILGDPRVLLAPTEPYRPGDRWYERGSRSLVEIPIRVTRVVRAPVFGGSISLSGPSGARLLVRACGAPACFNLELHALDFLDAADGLADLAPHQPELRIPLARRRASLDAAMRELARARYRFATLEQAAIDLG